jgi:hypothetical protein
LHSLVYTRRSLSFFPSFPHPKGMPSLGVNEPPQGKPCSILSVALVKTETRSIGSL